MKLLGILQRKCWCLVLDDRLGLAAVFLLTFLAIGCSSGGGLSEDQGSASDHLIAARKALDANDTAAALKALDASVAASPSVWAYIERAQLRAKQGDTQGALEDCDAGLELSPGNLDFKWLEAEIKKPAAKRFKGANSTPPSHRK